MNKRVNKAYQRLIELMERGREFPDATAEVSQEFSLSDKESVSLVALYDEEN